LVRNVSLWVESSPTRFVRSRSYGLQRCGEGVEHAVGDAGGVSAFEAGVVVDADSGEQRDLFAAQAGDAAVVTVDREAYLLGGDFRAAAGEEFADLALGVHLVSSGYPRCAGEWEALSVPGSTGTLTRGDSVLS